MMKWLLCFLPLFQQCFCQTEFRFANIYGDNMVLQQSPDRSQVWSYSTSANDVITAQLIVSSTNSVVETVTYTTNSNLIWRVQFSPVAAKNDYEYTISVTSKTLSNKTISLTGILFGDVYVCSGQSNMQFTVDQAFNASEEVEAANNYPNIRVFCVGKVGSGSPQLELPLIELEWSVASSKSIGGGGNWTYFSAVCWFFGRNLFNELDYPIGLIASSYGGTIIEDWMAPEALALCNDTVNKNNKNNNKNNKHKTKKRKQKLEKTFQNKIKTFKNSNKNDNKNNSKNKITAQQQDDFMARLARTMTINTNTIEKHDVHAFSSASTSKSTFTSPQLQIDGGFGADVNDTALWNAMIYPLLFTTIKGVIWYQGESDAGYSLAPEYTCTFARMINSWRYYWSTFSDTSSTFPFGFVELSTWEDNRLNKTCGNNYNCTLVPIVRYGQTANYGYIPNPRLSENIYFATAIDLGDPGSPWGDVHPRYKQQVGKRLSDAAMNVIYGDTERFGYIQGPVADSVTTDSGNNSLIINFRNVGEKGLNVKNSVGFEVYSSVVSNIGWIDAPLKNEIEVIGNGGFDLKMVLDSGTVNVGDIEFVRYNWYQAPCQPTVGIYLCSVYDMQYALPAIPFVIQVNGK